MPPIVSAIVPAAGRGERLNSQGPKQFMALGDRPLLAWSVERLLAAGVMEVIVGASPDRLDQVRGLIGSAAAGKSIKVVAGGAERQETVRSCLAAVRADAEVVVIHDAARPFASIGLIEKVVRAAAEFGAATAAIRPVDAIKMESNGGGTAENLDRGRLWRVQTPQAFRADLIREAHERAAKDGFLGLDDTTLVERMGAPVEMVEGEVKNFKITTAEDWEIATALVKAGVEKPE